MNDLLELLVCPKSRGELELVELPEALAARLIQKYKEHFDGEEPQVSQGLLCRESDLLYPIIDEIPVLLEEEALPASALEGG